MDRESLVYTTWNNIESKTDIEAIMIKLCEYKGIEIIGTNACRDHIHMLISVLPKLSVAQLAGYLKGKDH